MQRLERLYGFLWNSPQAGKESALQLLSESATMCVKKELKLALDSALAFMSCVLLFTKSEKLNTAEIICKVKD